MASTKTSTPNKKNNGGGTAGDINPSPEWSAVAPLIFLILGAMVLSRYMESIKSFLTIVVPLVAAAAVGYYLYTIASSQPTTTAAAAESVDVKNDKSMSVLGKAKAKVSASIDKVSISMDAKKK